jgi:hypothetical protein
MEAIYSDRREGDTSKAIGLSLTFKSLNSNALNATPLGPAKIWLIPEALSDVLERKNQFSRYHVA